MEHFLFFQMFLFITADSGFYLLSHCPCTKFFCFEKKECTLIQSAVHHEVFTAGALEARVRRTSAFRAPAGKTE